MTVRWTPQAAADLEQLCDHIQKDNPEAALTTARRIYTSIETLQRHPNRGRVGRVQGTRELVLTPLPYIGVYELQQRSSRSVAHPPRRPALALNISLEKGRMSPGRGRQNHSPARKHWVVHPNSK